MKFGIKVQSGSQTADHIIELPSGNRGTATAGQVGFVLDGIAEEIDWAEVEPGVYSLLAGGKSYIVFARREANASSNGEVYQISMGTRSLEVEVRDSRARRRTSSGMAHSGPLEILAPMPGRIIKILVKEDSQITPGEGLLVIEAMKMQNEIRAPRAGQVEKIYVREGEGVETGAKLAVILDHP